MINIIEFPVLVKECVNILMGMEISPWTKKLIDVNKHKIQLPYFIQNNILTEEEYKSTKWTDLINLVSDHDCSFENEVIINKWVLLNACSLHTEVRQFAKNIVLMDWAYMKYNEGKLSLEKFIKIQNLKL